MDQLAIRQSYDFLHSEHLLWGGSMKDDEDQYGWDFQIADRIYDFRDVDTLAEYLGLRHGQEMRAAQPAQPTLAQQQLVTIVQPQPDPRKVFVIHGRDAEAKDAMFGFLRDLDLHPLEWEELVSATGQATPYTGEVVARAFSEAQAVVALLSPDNEVRLHPSLWDEDEEPHEVEFRGQPRPNVYFEAGMAFNANPGRTILVEIGKMPIATDLGGRNTIRLGPGPKPLLALYNRLELAKCAVRKDNPRWMDTTRFASLGAYTRHKDVPPSLDTAKLPTGYLLKSAPKPSAPGLRARLYPQGGGKYLFEVTNTGGVSLQEVEWSLPPEARNLKIVDHLLPKYPIPDLPSGRHVRVPVSVTMGGVAMAEITLKAKLPDGTPFEANDMISIYG